MTPLFKNCPANILEAWLEVQREYGLEPKEILVAFTKGIGMKVRHNRLSEWRLGRRPIPRYAYDFLLRELQDEIADDIASFKGTAESRGNRLATLIRAPLPNQRS